MPKIQKELIERRTANSKTFDLSKGKRRLVTQIGDVHYKDNYADPSELWKDIYLNWEGNRITKAPYELTHEGNKLTLKNKRTGNITTIELLDIGGKKIPDVAWERSRGLARAPGIVTVEDVALDTDLEIIAEFSAVRFRRVLKSDKAPLETKFKVTGDTSLVMVRASDEDGDIPVESSLKNGILTETLKPDRAVKYPVEIDPTWQIVTGSDDCYRQLVNNIFELFQSEQMAGYLSDANRQRGGGMRFTNITIPQGTIIDTAHLTLRAERDRPDTVCNSRISAEDVDDAVTFSSQADYDARFANHTTARVDWDNISTWTKNVDYNSAEIKTVIKEIVDRGGWQSGYGIVIFWEDHDNRSTQAYGCLRMAYSYDGNSTYCPKLVIEYITVSAPTVTTQAATNVGTTTARLNGQITDDGGEACEGRFRYRKVEGAYSYTAWVNGLVTNDPFYADITGLDQGSTYQFNAQARNSAGESDWGSELEFTTGGAFEKVLTEILGCCDTCAKAVSTVKTEPLGLLDTVVKSPSLVKTEPLGLLDTYSRTWAIYRVLTEDLGLVDAYSRTWTIYRTYSELLGLADAVAKMPSKTLPEALGLSDILTKEPGKVLAEPLGLVDVYSRTWDIYRTYTELLGLLDTVAKGVVLHPLTETLGLLDSVVKSPSIVKGELLGLKDSIVKDASVIKGEVLGLTDTLAKGVSLPLSETLGLLDTVTKSASIIKAESLGLEDRVSKHVSLHALTEVLGLLDSISYSKNPTVLAKLIRKLIQIEDIGGGGQD